MKNIILIITALVLLLSLTAVFSQQSKWKVKDGWAMRKEAGKLGYEKFFAVGVWNIPGYNKEAMENDPEGYRKSAKIYLDKSDNYNAVYLSPGKDKDSKGRVEVTGSIGFYETLKEIQSRIPNLSSNKDNAYQARQYIKENVNSEWFTAPIDSMIKSIKKAYGKNDYIWAPIDEIVNGGAGSGWCWHPEVGEMIKERINKECPNTLVFTDLVGIARGNAYLFEKNYLKKHSDMPKEVPYSELGEDAQFVEERPLLGFVQGYDGSPVYVNGSLNYVDYSLYDLKRLFYENMKICAKDYRKCGDVFGINAFIDCNTYPELAGITVDAIKAGAGKDTPVWMFFDGNGYAKPSDVNASDFIKNLKCQMYTSIIHGATGILFWNDRSLSPEVFDNLEPIVAEIQNNIPIFCMNTETVIINNDTHCMVKTNGINKEYLIAANTSKTKTLNVNIAGFESLTLEPYQVKIIEKK
ncbi:MAG: hypothetical protein Q4F97_10070 [Bacteroidales bacterium]|nr:hypothetical protein [Bacteroidales bacterium]